MRTAAVALVSALAGGAIAAGGVTLLSDDDRAAPERTVVRQAPLDAAAEGLTPAEIYRRDAPGVVFILAEVVQPTQSPFDLFPTEQRGQSTGTGFVIDDDGSILTNAHVVQDARSVAVRFSDGKTVPAEIKGRDVSTDIALLEVDPEEAPLKPLELGTSRDVEVGDPTVAIGNPFGLDLTLTTGVISAKQRRIEAPNGFTIDDVLQTDAAINPGNSGGPLIDAAGKVIGINSQIRTGGAGGGSIGLGFAVPIDTARRILPELRENGRVERPYLGVGAADAPRGALVQEVRPGSPAARAGLAPGDVITRIGNTAVDDAADVGAAVDAREPGDRVTLEVRRGDATDEVEVELVQRPDTVGGP